MNLKLTRKTYTTLSTIGDLEIDGKFQCFVLEDPVRPKKIKGETAIRAGKYNIIIDHSPKFGRLLPLLENVPEFEGIRIHPGNTAADTEGCLLVGETQAVDSIGTSKVAFEKLFTLLQTGLKGGGSVSIEIVEGGTSPFMKDAAPPPPAVQGDVWRVTADPLRLRSTGDDSKTTNIVARLPFGLLVTATGGDTPAGWTEVDAVVDGVSRHGFVSTQHLERVPASTASGSATVRSLAAAAPAAPAVEENTLFRAARDQLNLRSEAANLSDDMIIAALPLNHLVRKLRATPKPMWWEVETVVNGKTVTGFVNSALLAPAQAGAVPAPETSATAAPAATPGATTGTISNASSSDVQVSEAALQLILDFEGMDQPSKWPGQASGISLGHGYDLGYHSLSLFRGDWGPHLTPDQLDRLSAAVGKKGQAAANIAFRFTDIRITKAAADAVFMHSTVPQIKLWAAQTFPGVQTLPPDAQGALTSLVYNRGTDLQGPRRKEMLDIRTTVADASLSLHSKLIKIADLILAMNRLWLSTDPASGHPGIRRRRKAEAKLVQDAA